VISTGSIKNYSQQEADRVRQYRAVKVSASQDVYETFGEEIERGPLNPKRRNAAGKSLRKFYESYGPKSFYLKWSPRHLESILLTEKVVLEGGMYANAEPRGGGKTTRCWWAALWASLYGYSHYSVLIGATQSSAEKKLLKNIKTTLRFNQLLREDFPEVICPILHLNNESRRCSGQHYQGQPTTIEWGSNLIVLPTIPGSQASGTIIDVTGMEGEIRGRQYLRQDGVIARPQFCLADDPQTRATAKSPTQCKEREDILAGDVMGMAGPGEKLGVLIPCTVIYKDDMADRILDRKRHPEYHGTRTRMLESFPSSMQLWEEYSEIRKESIRNNGDGEEATEFYIKNRKAMDKGSKVSWKERKKEKDISAIQHAMNLYFKNQEVFFAEYQNDPLSDADSDVEMLTADEIMDKMNGIKHGVVPADSQFTTAFIDISQRILWHGTCGWDTNFTGHVIDYGIYPDQKSNYVSASTAKRTLKMKYPGAGLDGAIYAGLNDLIDSLMDREWTSEIGGVSNIDLLIIDANWGEHSELVYNCIRRSKHSNRILPMHGRGVRASQRPIIDPNKRKKPGERRGLHWIIDKSKHSIKKIGYDTNYWKSFTHKRLIVPTGSRGSLSLFKTRATRHQMFADQMTAEKPTRVEANGRVVNEWQMIPGRKDNHFLDVITGCAVGASVLGCTTEVHEVEKKSGPRKRTKLSDRKKVRA
jgi:Terminase large subunit gpA, endonuclease domain